MKKTVDFRKSFCLPPLPKVEGTVSSEMLVSLYLSTYCHNPEGPNFDAALRTPNLTFTVAVLT
jgi:hypothetical protein